MGYENLSDVSQTVDSICGEAIEAVEQYSSPAFVYSYFDIDVQHNGVALCSTPLLLEGKSISRHLLNCTRAAVFCATLSNSIDRIISGARFNLSRQLFLDTAASVYLEQICEYICKQIQAENLNLFMTKRYGIGYGDLSLDYQQDILTILNAQKRIGVMATGEGILTPRKSVTAVIGLSKNEIDGDYRPCDSCLLRHDCKYFAKGEYCGK